MIARIDDVAKFMMDELKPNPDYNFTLLARLCWSKNIYEERLTPNQILLGANDPKYCVLLALSIHLETWIGRSTGCLSPYLFALYGTTPEFTKKTSI